MTQWTESQIEKIIEQATHHVMLAMQAAEASGAQQTPTEMVMSAHDYLQKVQPVVNAAQTASPARWMLPPQMAASAT